MGASRYDADRPGGRSAPAAGDSGEVRKGAVASRLRSGEDVGDSSRRPIVFVLCLTALFAPGLASAGEADVLNATARKTGAETWTIPATVRHDDTGWEHYADAFQVLTTDGQELGLRILYHPHETEQPFTRSLSGVHIPPDIAEVVVRARDKVHGYGGRAFTLRLPR